MSNENINNARDPAWVISFDCYDAADEKRREAILALGNGRFVTRAAAIDTKAGKVHYPGTYYAGCYNRVQNEIIGEYDETESLVNLPNWLPLVFRVKGGPWIQFEDSEVLCYSHGLDLRSGLSWRQYVVHDGTSFEAEIRESRVVSMADPQLCALKVEITSYSWSGEIEVRAALDGNILNTNVKRYEDYQHRHLVRHRCEALSDNEAVLIAHTSHSRATVAQAMRTLCNSQPCTLNTLHESDTAIAHIIETDLKPEQTLTIEKLVGFCTTCDSGISDAKQAAQEALQRAGSFNQICSAHERVWKELWSRVSIDIADPGIARSIRFHAFQILQTISPHTCGLDIGIPARGWHGEAYHGHIFWDELFVHPFLNFRFPLLAKESLLYRYRRLDAARRAARQAGYRGAMYPWRSASDGREVTPRHQKNLLNGQWMHDYTFLQRHIGSAIAFNIWNYYLATGDMTFMEQYGAEMMFEIARFWSSIACYSEERGRFEIKGIIGPDEYHNAYPDRQQPGLDNNAYTNVMAAWTLCRALEVLDFLPEKRSTELRNQLGLGNEEIALWDRISRKIYVPFHGEYIISQFEGFERLPEFRHELLPADFTDERIDWALQEIGKSADEFQVTKQADALTLFYLLPEYEVIELLGRLGYNFDEASIYRTAHYYYERSVHRSSLSHTVYAGALARVDPRLSWKLFLQVLDTDLSSLKGETTAEGIHLGAMGGSIDIIQRRYLGVAARMNGLRIDPCFPAELGNIRFGLQYHGNALALSACNGLLEITSAETNKTGVVIYYQNKQNTLMPGEKLVVAELNGASRQAAENDQHYSM